MLLRLLHWRHRLQLQHRQPRRRQRPQQRPH
jgi:hypothetical protein